MPWKSLLPMNRVLLRIFLVLAVVSASAPCAFAQFKEEAFKQSYNDDEGSSKDSVDVLFSFPEYWQGITHKGETRIGTLFAGSCLLLGGEQIYNKDYWKLPLVYGSVLGGAGAGLYFNSHGKQDIAKYCFIGAGVAYWATHLDGITCYKPAPYPYAGKATLYSLLLPGLGQAYNREFWKIPIYVGGLAAAVHFYDINNLNYQRFRNIYIKSTNPDVPYDGPISSETALYYRNIYRTYRDYSVVAIALVYLIQVIDANVFAYMHDFEVVDDLVLDFTPTIITPECSFASCGFQQPAIGMQLGLRF